MVNIYEGIFRSLCAILSVWLGCVASVCADSPTTNPAIVAEPVYECADPHYREFLEKNYVLFEVGQVHPLELSADGQWLFALNSPLGCLEIYRVEAAGLRLASSVVVGLQPVSVRVRSAQEVWVVNHLSDNVSVVELSGRPRIKQILQVGDAPFDVVFAGKDSSGNAMRAYLSCSARGQHHPTFELQNLVSNIIEYPASGGVRREKLGAADLWVYDIGSEPRLEGIINPFMSSLRSLAVSEDGKTVYAAGFLSGNQTTSVVTDPEPVISSENLGSIATARIVKKNGNQWLDSAGNDFSAQVQIDLPDIDVVAIDASSKPLPFHAIGGKVVTNTNRQLIKQTFTGMGSVLFSLAVDGERLLLSALDSHNETSLEENLLGKATSNMLVVQQAQFRNNIKLDDISGSSSMRSLPLPGAIEVGKKYIYVASFGSSRVGLFKRELQPAALSAAGIIDLQQELPDGASGKKSLVGMGPAGIAELPTGGVVILSRLDNALHVMKPDNIHVDSFVRLQKIEMFNPESPAIVQGRRFLYDADKTGNGKMACGSCHIFGDWDGLAWDIGSAADRLVRNDRAFIEIGGALVENMGNTVRAMPLRLPQEKYDVGSMVPVGRYEIPLCFKGSADELYEKLQMGYFGKKPCVLYMTEAAVHDGPRKYLTAAMANSGQQWASVNFPYFLPLKGPMGTQSLFGLEYGGAMHHRGDRSGDEPASGNHCPSGKTVAERAFKEFNQPCDGGVSSFHSLLGGLPLTAHEMDAFAKFTLGIHFPPNPHRAFNNIVPVEWSRLFSKEKIAKDITNQTTMSSVDANGIASCSQCHMLSAKSGHFGGATNLYYSAPHIVTQDMDVPDFRNFYRKLGLYIFDYRQYFGTAGESSYDYHQDNRQVSGFGFFHNAAFDAVNAVFNPFFFKYPGDRVTVGAAGEMIRSYDVDSRKKLFYYLGLFDTDVYPVAGQQRIVGEKTEDISDISSPEFCRTYGFAGGEFHVGASAVNMPSSIISCYPVLQAEGYTQ